MKFVFASIFIVILISAALSYVAQAYTPEIKYSDEDLLQWYNWKNKWLRDYISTEEEERRKDAFFKNDKEIQDLNTLWFGPITPEVSHYEIRNSFTDTTTDEWIKLDQSYPEPDDDDSGVVKDPSSGDSKQKDYVYKFRSVNSSWTSVKGQLYRARPGTVPARLDWRKRLVVPNFESVCCMIDCLKASYAWAVAVTLISHRNIRTLEDSRADPSKQAVKPTIYSIQQLVDCLTTDNSDFAGTNFCKSEKFGGNGQPNSVVRAYKHVIMNGLMFDGDYKYKRGNMSECSYNQEEPKDREFTGYTQIARDDFGNFDEVALMQALAFYGPITVSFNANSKSFWRYTAGVIEPKECKKGKTVSMVLVGYGVERGLRYWLLMTPWGERFGRHGMIKLIRLSDIKSCNLATQAIFPTWQGRKEVTSYDFDYWTKLEGLRANLVKRVYSNDDLSDGKTRGGVVPN